MSYGLFLEDDRFGAAVFRVRFSAASDGTNPPALRGRAAPMTRRNRTIRQSAARNSYSRETRPMPPQRSRDVAKESSSDPESLPAAISWRTGRNSSSRWNAIPSETQTNVEAMRLRRSGDTANSFAEFEPCTQWPYSSWTSRLSSSPGHGRAALRSSVVARKISREWSVRVSRPYAAPDGVEFAKYGGVSMISVE